MGEKVLRTLFVVAAVAICVAATPAKRAVPGDVSAPVGKTPGSVVSAPRGSVTPGGTDVNNYFRARGENCYLVFSNFGLFGCHTFQEDYGFHFNVGTYNPPEKYSGLYSWTEAPTLPSYNDYVESVTSLPVWLQLPSSGNLTVRYRAKWDIEEDFDGVELVISTIGNPTKQDNLHPTSAVLGSGQIGQPSTSRYYYEGETSQWMLEEADINAYLGKQVKIRFYFRSDTSNYNPHHGIYIDEFQILQDTTVLYENGFENKSTDAWDSDVVQGNPQEDGWGFSESLPAEINLLNNGQFMAGASASYVADAFTPDWLPTSNGTTNYVRYSNAGTRQPSDPEYRVDQYIYPYSDYVIVDCYVKNGKPEAQSNIYGGVRMNVDIRHNDYERDDDERVIYKSAQRMAMFYDDGQLDQPVCGVMYLAAGNASPTSVNFTNVMDEWMLDGTNFNYMSNGELDYADSASAVNRWAVVIGEGPHQLNMSETFRFAFAILGGDDESDLLANATACRNTFATLPDKTPISVAPTSFGNIKAMFR
ncbi:MAG: immune inhibitor A [Candidatus Zixiibacteriota bacterium]|jgi:hypothetical protein